MNVKQEKSILILEDDFDLVCAWQVALEECGYSVDSAGAYEIAESCCMVKQYDLIICDILILGAEGNHLPQGGASFLIYLRSSVKSPRWCRTVPVIVISGAGGRGQFNIAESFRRIGATEAFSKPVQIETLVEVVSHYL